MTDEMFASAALRYAKLQEDLYGGLINAAIFKAVSGRTLVGDSTAQKAATFEMIRRLLSDCFEVDRDSAGNLVVYDKVTRKSADEILKDRLDSHPFSLFFQKGSL